MKKRIYVLFLAVLMLCAFTSAKLSAATKKKMTVYDTYIKSGNILYYNLDTGLYKVNLKTKKAKRLYQKDIEPMISSMRVKGKYLYFILHEPADTILCRINTSTGKLKKIVSKTVKRSGDLEEDACVERYVISGSKVYYQVGYNSKDGIYDMVMKLNGQGKKKSKVKTVMKSKKSNVKGYKVITKSNNKMYLKTPKTTIYLGKLEWN